MERTSLAFLENEELLTLTQCKDNRTELEVELAQRLTTAIDYIEELEHTVEEITDQVIGVVDPAVEVVL